MKKNFYKDTLNLPHTEFPMKANLSSMEITILDKWKNLDIYKKILQSRNKEKSFYLSDGPPYANGDIHIGHALNKILKDIIIKSKSISGFYTPFIPGWDCHGLPIEIHIEKKEGKAGYQLDATTFRKKCREYAAKQIDIQRNSFKRLGIFGDWENPYITMDNKFEANIIRTLGRVIANGHLIRGNSPVHWCIHCSSALAEAEVKYKEKHSDAIYVSCPIVDNDEIDVLFNVKLDKPISIIIWTTTPWTLPANKAIAVNKNIKYVLVEYKEQCIIVAEALLSSIRRHIKGIGQTLGNCLGKHLELKKVTHPLYKHEVPIITSNHVTTNTGTGCVHIAPAHGIDDYIASKRYNLSIDSLVDANGYFIKSVPKFNGIYIFKANQLIIKTLDMQGYLLFHQKLKHSYPYCWRHMEPLIFRTTSQWFISMQKNKLSDSALNAIKNVQWIPSWGKARMESMLKERPDWCISRQRTWGTPMPLFVHKYTGELHPRTLELIEQVANIVDKEGIDSWFSKNITDFLPFDEAQQYIKVSDTLDVWFDSGAVHACVADIRPEMHSPVNLYLEGSDQHRGWFQSSLLLSLATKGIVPYKQVLTHGFTVDAKGKKMSKSLGNVILPEKIVKTLGADILRLWVAATYYKNELPVSDEIIKRTSDTYRRIRNTARFLLSNLHDFDPKKDLVSVKNMILLDYWIVNQVQQLQSQVISYYDSYQFHIIYHKIHNFCSLYLGGFYLDIIKDRQYTCKTDSIPRRSAQTAMYYLIETLVRCIAPILSFTAEEIWQFIPGARQESVFLETWYQDLPVLSEKITMNNLFWQQILPVRNEVNKALEEARKTNFIGSSLEAKVILYCNQNLYTILQKLKDELRFVLITSEAFIKKIDKNTKVNSTEINGLHIEIIKSENPKCNRCWHHCIDVNLNIDYPNICGRCIKNISSSTGEYRAFA